MEDFREVPPSRRTREGIEKQELVAPGGGPTNPSSEVTRPSHNKVESLARCWLDSPSQACLPLASGRS